MPAGDVGFSLVKYIEVREIILMINYIKLTISSAKI